MNTLIQESPLLVLPTLAKAIGLNEAIFLQQLQYWLNHPNLEHIYEYDGVSRRWIYNTYADWTEQFPFWSSRTIKRIVSSLRDKGLIITTSEFNKMPTDRTTWYTINYDRLRECQLDIPQSDKLTPPMNGDNLSLSKVSDSHHVTRDYYTETTTEIKDVLKQLKTSFPGVNWSLTKIISFADSVLTIQPVEADKGQIEFRKSRIEKTVSSVIGEPITLAIA